MNLGIIGTGYVGLVTGACFSEMGINVTCTDTDTRKISLLNNGEIPIYEPGLKELVRKNKEAQRLHFNTSLEEILDAQDALFIAVGTPPGENGSADLSHVIEVARTIGRNIKKYTLVVTKSTVPVGTSIKVKSAIEEEIAKRGERGENIKEITFDVASNPEFLKEGAAIKDFMSPDRVIIGTDSPKAKSLMEKIYKPFHLSNFRIIYMDILSAEMTKYAANSMLATRISFMNEIARLCEITGANVECVRAGIASDTRIGSKFLYPGCGYGGSCFPKDVKALIKTGQEHGCKMRVISAVEEVNDSQKKIVFEKLLATLPSLAGKRIALWGLAFKPETDDMREAPSVVVAQLLKEAGAIVVAYDPIAMEESKRLYLGDSIEYAPDPYTCVKEADALSLITEWKEFRIPDWRRIKELMRGNVIIDGRNIYNREELEAQGFKYIGIGK